jgi:hypothetical protein
LHAHVPYDLTVDASVMNPNDCALAIKHQLKEGATLNAFHRLQHMPMLDEEDNE